jgi:hypothetical protein
MPLMGSTLRVAATALSPEQLSPFMRIEISRERTTRHRAADGANAVAKTARDERVVTRGALDRNQGSLATTEDQQAGIDRWCRLEGTARQTSCERALIPGTPKHATDAARPRQRTLHGNTPLHNQIGPHKRCPRIIKQPMQEIVRATKRQIRDDTKRLGRQLPFRGVAFDHLDVRPTAAQPSRQTRIEFHRDDAASNPGKLGGQPARARPQIDHQIARANTGITNQLRRQTAPGKEMLTTRRRQPRATSAPTCHGTAPLPSRNP